MCGTDPDMITLVLAGVRVRQRVISKYFIQMFEDSKSLSRLILTSDNEDAICQDSHMFVDSRFLVASSSDVYDAQFL